MIQHEFVEFVELERLRGICISFIYVIPISKLLIRRMTEALAEAEKEGCHRIKITPRLFEELREWLEMRLIKLKRCWELPPIEATDRKSCHTFTDASTHASGWVTISDNKISNQTLYFSEADQQEIICIKEAKAILQMLTFNKNLANKRIHHYCDNNNVVLAYRNLGSRNSKLNDLIRAIYYKLHQMNSSMHISWIASALMVADMESRIIDYNEEYLPYHLFKIIESAFKVNFTLDLMASDANYKTEKFIGLNNIIASKAFDFDIFNLKIKIPLSDIIFCFPPKNYANRVCSWIAQNLYRNKIAILTHAYSEISPGIAALIEKKFVILNINRKKFTIIPDEHKTELDGKIFWGKLNDKKVNFILVTNMSISEKYLNSKLENL